ncbi:MAG TPA: alpha/beta fold hydrolase [Gammaproteobacteria bacterium]
MKGTVVLVHGLWMSGAEMALLRHRLRRCGYRVFQFRYRTVGCSVSENARRLNKFLDRVPGHRLHFVAHSLGGLVVRQLFHDFPRQRPGRIVTLGSPHTGSDTARYLARNGHLRRAFGKALPPLAGKLPEWHSERELGSIAGTLSIGIAWFIEGLPKPNDGTVATVETHLPGMSDYLELPVTHTGLLFSRRVAQQVCQFIKTGHFKAVE